MLLTCFEDVSRESTDENVLKISLRYQSLQFIISVMWNVELVTALNKKELHGWDNIHQILKINKKGEKCGCEGIHNFMMLESSESFHLSGCFGAAVAILCVIVKTSSSFVFCHTFNCTSHDISTQQSAQKILMCRCTSRCSVKILVSMLCFSE